MQITISSGNTSYRPDLASWAGKLVLLCPWVERIAARSFVYGPYHRALDQNIPRHPVCQLLEVDAQKCRLTVSQIALFTRKNLPKKRIDCWTTNKRQTKTTHERFICQCRSDVNKANFFMTQPLWSKRFVLVSVFPWKVHSFQRWRAFLGKGRNTLCEGKGNIYSWKSLLRFVLKIVKGDFYFIYIDKCVMNKPRACLQYIEEQPTSVICANLCYYKESLQNLLIFLQTRYILFL